MSLATARHHRAAAPLAAAAVEHLTRLYGLPGDRASRLAARYAFAKMKESFMRAVQPVPGSAGDVLRRKVRGADDPVDLWRLRRAVFGVLPESHPASAGARADIQRHLDALFPDSLHNSGFMGL